MPRRGRITEPQQPKAWNFHGYNRTERNPLKFQLDSGTEVTACTGYVFERQPAKLYRFCTSDGRSCGGFQWPLPTKNEDGSWTPGDWAEVAWKNDGRSLPNELRHCYNGLHAFTPAYASQFYGGSYGHDLYEMETDGVVSFDGTKWVAARARLLRKVPYDRAQLNRNYYDPEQQAQYERQAKANWQAGEEWLAAHMPKIKRAINAHRREAMEIASPRAKEAIRYARRELRKNPNRSLQNLAQNYLDRHYRILRLKAEIASLENYDWNLFQQAKQDISKQRRIDNKALRKLQYDHADTNYYAAFNLVIAEPGTDYYGTKAENARKLHEEEIRKINERAAVIKAELDAEYERTRVAPEPVDPTRFDPSSDPFGQHNWANKITFEQG